MPTERGFHVKLVLGLKVIRAVFSLSSPDHPSFGFRPARDWASPPHGRDPDALQIIYRIIRSDTVANPDRSLDGCATITYHEAHGRVDVTHLLNGQPLLPRQNVCVLTVKLEGHRRGDYVMGQDGWSTT